MIGRLVEQQQIGLGKQHRRQRHPHAPAARQLVERPFLHRGVEPEPGQDPRRPARRRMGVDVVQPRLDLADAQRRRSRIAFGEQRGPLLVGGEHGGERIVGAARRFLGEKADAIAARQSDRAGIGLRRTADQRQQGRFAGAVAADQPDPAARRNLRAGLIQQGMSADAVGQAGDRQHRRILSRPHCGAR